MVMDFSKVHRVRLPAWRSENLTPSRPTPEKLIQGFSDVSAPTQKDNNQPSQWRDNIMAISPFDQMSLLMEKTWAQIQSEDAD